MVWFTADWHLYHDAIIELTSRNFRTAHKMMNNLIRNYKEQVRPGDTCYFLGDFFWGCSIHNLENVLKKLPGRKILILGNHDLVKPFDYVEAGFHSVHTSIVIPHFVPYKATPHTELINLVHDPALSQTDRKTLFLCGHVHELFETQANVINVGVDVREYKPVSINQVQAIKDNMAWFKEA